jgi:hypothetical protein
MTDRDQEIADLKRRLAALEADQAADAAKAEAAPAAPGRTASVGAAPGFPSNPLPARTSSVWPWIVGGAAAIGVIILVMKPRPAPATLKEAAAISAKGSNGAAAADGAAKAALEAATAAAAAASAAQADAEAAAEAAGAWSYDERADAITDKPTYTACLSATNEIHLDSPYPSQNARFCFRRDAKFGFDAMLSLPSGGQFMCRSYEDCTVKIRVDDGPIRNYAAVEPSDGSSDVIFIRAAQRLSDALKGAKRLRIEAEYYEAGVQTADFNVDKYDASKLSAKAASAGK